MLNKYQSCIEACLRCAAACNFCASSCLAEDDVKEMAKCVRYDMECAVICYTAAHLMSMNSEYAKDICKICADICNKCGEECGKHNNEHCQKCAEACQACADECLKMN